VIRLTWVALPASVAVTRSAEPLLWGASPATHDLQGERFPACHGS
jgi:hypothetical protein